MRDMELALNMSGDESCTFMSENFDEWLEKNGCRFVSSNEYLNGTMLSGQQDPLLNQVGPAALSDNEDSDLVLHELNGTEKADKTQDEEVDASADRTCLALAFAPLTSKSEYLETKMRDGISVQFLADVKENNIKLIFYDSDNTVIFPDISISLADTGAVTAIPKQQLAVSVLEKVVLAKDLIAIMPCLQLQTGLRICFCPKQECNMIHLKVGPAKLHALMHIGHKPFKCDYPNCTWAFYNSFKLRRHQECHSSQKEYNCGFADCNKQFTNVYNLKIHMRNHSRPAIFGCTVLGCTKKFQTSRLRDKHFKTHDATEAPFACTHENCSKYFFLSTGLAAHSRTHSYKQSDVKCDYPNCGKVFEQPCRLKEHLRSHTGQRPYSCTFRNCTWTFATASKLKRHQCTHTRERKFHCTMGNCNKSFLRSEHLKEHTLAHIGQRSFNCEACPATFLTKSTLCSHVKKTHPEKSGACARATPYIQTSQKPSADLLLEQAIQSLGVPSDMMLGGGLLPEGPLDLLENDNFSTVNLRDLD